jgi:hypothetical protein
VEILNMKRTLGLVAATALASAAFLSPAEAAPTITVSPVTQNVANGGTATVDIDVSGLTQGVGGFSFDLGFDPTLLSGISFANDPGVTMGAAPLDLSGGFSSGNLDTFFVADGTATEGSLSAAQGTGFVLTQLTFGASAVNSGLSALTLSNFVLSESDGATSIGGVTASNGQICVGSCGGGVQSAPEIDPAGALSAFTLLAGGLAVMRGRRIRK